MRPVHETRLGPRMRRPRGASTSMKAQFRAPRTRTKGRHTPMRNRAFSHTALMALMALGLLLPSFASAHERGPRGHRDHAPCEARAHHGRGERHHRPKHVRAPARTGHVYRPAGNTTYRPRGDAAYRPAGDSAYRPGGDEAYRPRRHAPVTPRATYRPARRGSTYAPEGQRTYRPSGDERYTPRGHDAYRPGGG